MMTNKQAYLSADICGAADREVLGESASVLADLVLHGGSSLFEFRILREQCANLEKAQAEDKDDGLTGNLVEETIGTRIYTANRSANSGSQIRRSRSERVTSDILVSDCCL